MSKRTALVGTPQRRFSARVLRAVANVLVGSFAFGCQGVAEDVKLVLITGASPAALTPLSRGISALAGELGPVAVEVIPLPEFTLKETMLGVNVAHHPWDLAIVPSSWLPQLEQQQAIFEVPSHYAEQLEARLTPLAALGVRANGKTVAYPLAAEVSVLMLNPSLIPSLPSSLADFNDLHLPTGVLPLALDLTDPSLALPLLGSALGSPGIPARDERPEALRRLRQQLARVLSSDESRELCLEPKGERIFAQLFVERRLAAFIGSPKVLPFLGAHQLPFTVAPVPPSCSHCPPPRVWASFLCVVVSTSCPYPDLAQELAFRLSATEANLRVSLAMKMLPVLGGDESAKFIQEYPELLGFQRALASAQLIPDQQKEFAYQRDWKKELWALFSQTSPLEFTLPSPGRQR